MAKGWFTSPEHFRQFREATMVMVPPDVHVAFRASHWLAHGDLMAPSLLDLRAGPPRVGLFDWMDEAVAGHWLTGREPKAGEMCLTSDLAREYLERRWPGVVFVLLAQSMGGSIVGQYGAGDKPRSRRIEFSDEYGPNAPVGWLPSDPLPEEVYERHYAPPAIAGAYPAWHAMKEARRLPVPVLRLPDGVVDANDVFEQLLAECSAPASVLPTVAASWESAPADVVGNLRQVREVLERETIGPAPVMCGCRVVAGRVVPDATPGCPFCDGTGGLRRTSPAGDEADAPFEVGPG